MYVCFIKPKILQYLPSIFVCIHWVAYSFFGLSHLINYNLNNRSNKFGS